MLRKGKFEPQTPGPCLVAQAYRRAQQNPMGLSFGSLLPLQSPLLSVTFTSLPITAERVPSQCYISTLYLKN